MSVSFGTRRIAERFKEYLKLANPQNEEELRTNLQDPPTVLNEYQNPVQSKMRKNEQPMNKETYRRTWIYAVMERG